MDENQERIKKMSLNRWDYQELRFFIWELGPKKNKINTYSITI
jgi:hypothetical protein